MTHIVHKQQGNALWVILFALAMFGLLTAMISRTSSSVNNTGDYEQNQIRMSQIMRYATSIEQAVTRLQSINGCSESEISFDNDDVTGYENSNAPTDNSCHVFEKEGGGLAWRTSDLETLTWIISKSARIDEALSDTNDDIIVILRDIDENLCGHINTKLHGWSDIPDWDDGASGDLWTQANGSYGTGGALLMLPSAGPALDDDITSACFNNVQASEYDFYYVILKR